MRTKTVRIRHINLRATERQEKLIRNGAEATGISVSDFILESACLRAEHILTLKQDFIVSASQWAAFTEALDRPARVKPELVRLFALKSL